VAESLNVRGAVDLGALAARKDAEKRASAAPAGVVIDVTEATFQRDVLERSMTVPVVIDLWAGWCQPCKVLTPILEAIAADYGGRFVLAKVDTEAEQRIAAAFGVQAIPSVFAAIKGQPLPLFQGALPEPQVRKYIEALMAEAAKHDLTGNVTEPVSTADVEEAVEQPIDPDLEAAYTGMETGQWAQAETAFRRLLDRNPADEQAKVGLATAGLYRRVEGVDQRTALAAAEAALDDPAKQSAAADVLLAQGHAQAAFDRLIDCVRRTSGDARAAARSHLIELFDVVGAADPRVAKARVALANALF
jgi:putative thioredoxin